MSEHYPKTRCRILQQNIDSCQDRSEIKRGRRRQNPTHRRRIAVRCGVRGERLDLTQRCFQRVFIRHKINHFVELVHPAGMLAFRCQNRSNDFLGGLLTQIDCIAIVLSGQGFAPSRSPFAIRRKPASTASVLINEYSLSSYGIGKGIDRVTIGAEIAGPVGNHVGIDTRPLLKPPCGQWLQISVLGIIGDYDQ